jgi:hydrogenase nickel incorporation protein HypA/HybF
MHEGTLMRDLMHKIESVAQRANARRVTKVKIALGALSHMDEAHFREHFAISSRGTAAADAELDVRCLTDTTAPGAESILLESVDVAG